MAKEASMDDKKTVKMGSQDAGSRSGEDAYWEPSRRDSTGGGEQATVAAPAGGSPFVPLRPVDRPTPRPGGAPWEPAGWAVQPAYAPVAAGQPGGDAATMLLAQRPTAVFAWLVVMDGPDKGRIHQLRPEVTTVGRAAGANDVLILDDAASGQHLKIKREHEEGAEDQFVLFDLASSNGTYAGAKASYRAPANRVYRHALHDGDYLLVGETTLVFKQV
jgi:hypothetical protein